MRMNARHTHFLRMAGNIVLGAFVLAAIPAGAQTATPEDLRRSIEERSRELERITNQIHETEKNITDVTSRSKTLNREVQQFGYQINQLNLQLRSGEVTREKLQFEIQELGLEIVTNESTVARRREAITDALRRLAEKGRESVLLSFLEQKSLAESMLEVQSITAISGRLTDDLEELSLLNEIIRTDLEKTKEKHQGVERENGNLKQRKLIAEDQRAEQKTLLQNTKNQEKQYQAQLKKLEEQQDEIIKEVERVEKELRAQIQLPSLPTPRIGVLAWPSASANISQGYGSTAFALRTYRGKHHNGLDIAGPIGSEIYVAESGIVLAMGDQDKFCPGGAYGKYIVVRHENGLTTLYAHLSRQVVGTGSRVERGALIGYMGRSGWATGPHLHFTVWASDTYTMRSTRVCGSLPVGGDLDPTPYLGRPGSRT